MSKKIIKNGLLIDGNGGETKKDAVIVIDKDRIVYTGPEANYTATGEETIVDAQGGTILPGLIDTHVHMMMEFSPIARRLETPFSYKFYQAAKYLETTLHAGVTSVRDALGTDLGVKKAIEEGLISGPRLQLSINALTITAGHGYGYTRSEEHT